MNPTLDRSFKGKFPFRLGTTSFIYPDDYVPNVRRLGPFLDEIELLLFDSAYPGALPSAKTVAELAELARDLDLTYNVHLPTDVFLGDESVSVRQRAVDTLLRVRDLTAPLDPTTLTLHLLPSFHGHDARNLGLWQDCLRKGLDRLIAGGISPESISVETLDYPFEWVAGIVSDLNLSVCMDLGHLIVHGYPMKALFDGHGDRVTIIHLHGVDRRGRDHLALDCMGKKEMAAVLEILAAFSGIVSLEVFSLSDLTASLPVLEKYFLNAQ